MIVLRQRCQRPLQLLQRDPTMTVSRVCQDSHDDFFRRPAEGEDRTVAHEIRQLTPVIIKLHVIKIYATATHHFQRLIIKPTQMRLSLQCRRHGAHGDDERWAKISSQPIDQSDDACQRHLFLHIQI